jgi:hypothetical protein
MRCLKMTEAQFEPANREQVKLIIFFTWLQKKSRLLVVSVKLEEFSPDCFQYNIQKTAETATELQRFKMSGL